MINKIKVFLPFYLFIVSILILISAFVVLILVVLNYLNSNFFYVVLSLTTLSGLFFIFSRKSLTEERNELIKNYYLDKENDDRISSAVSSLQHYSKINNENVHIKFTKNSVMIKRKKEKTILKFEEIDLITFKTKEDGYILNIIMKDKTNHNIYTDEDYDFSGRITDDILVLLEDFFEKRKIKIQREA